MGQIYQNLELHITSVPKGSVFVEIGSDRYNGSTHELDRLATKHGTKLISVDILPHAKNRVSKQLANTDFIVHNGRTWAEQYQGPMISCLYLDNFDYMYNVHDLNQNVQNQVIEYASRGVIMNNPNCQVEHLGQLLALYPHLEHDAVVMFDDTYLINHCWVGKCGPGVIFLLLKGWKIVEVSDDCGVIMKRP